MTNDPTRISVECGCCQGGRRPYTTCEGKRVPCPYCKDTGKREERIPHPTHVMSDWWSDILAPAGTPRFYSIRECKDCGEQEWQSAAGHFFHKLLSPCRGDQ